MPNVAGHPEPIEEGLASDGIDGAHHPDEERT
jgi:hypothetical protein